MIEMIFFVGHSLLPIVMTDNRVTISVSNAISLSRTEPSSLWLNEVNGLCRKTIEQFLEKLLKTFFFLFGTEENPLRVF